MYKLTDKQKEVLEEYLSYFRNDEELYDGIIWPDYVPNNIICTVRVKVVLKENRYTEQDRKVLNKFVRPVLIANRDWLPF